MLYREALDRFLTRVRNGQVCLGVHTSMQSAQVIELYGFAGLDFVLIGTEVESLDYGPVENLMRAANAANIVPMVKLRRPDPNLVSDFMNFGATLLCTPHVTTGPQLQELVAATRFGDHGTRGECPIARYASYGMRFDESRAEANGAHVIIPMIEDVEAMDHLDDICAVDGVDIIQIGPIDFGRSARVKERGFGSSVVREAIDKIIEVARNHGKAVMTPLWISPSSSETYRQIMDWQIEHLVKRGVTILYQPDVSVISDHYRNLMPLRSIRVSEEADEPAGENVA